MALKSFVVERGFVVAISCVTPHGPTTPPIDTPHSPTLSFTRNRGTMSVQFAPVTILSFAFKLPQPYKVGHVCSEAEAESLNALLKKGLSKGLYKVLSAGIARTGVSEAQFLTPTQRVDIEDQGQEYIGDYSLGFSNGHDTQRAVRVEADRLARALLESQLYKQGKTSRDLEDSEKDQRIRELSASQSVREEAARRVRVTQEIASRAHSELLGEESTT